MIYINNTQDEQTIKLPLYSKASGNAFDLAIKRTTTEGGKYIGLAVTYVAQDRLFVTLKLVLPEGLTDGEYEYRLRENGRIIGGGIIVIEGARYADREHQQDITYKEYEQ